MQRRREEMRTNSCKIGEECLSISQILQRIMQKDAESVANLERLSEKQILSNTKHFLSVTKFQHSTMQKLTEIGIELEAFASETVTDDINESATSSILSPSDRTLKIEDQEISEKAIKSDSSNLSILGSSLKISDKKVQSLETNVLDEARKIALIEIESDKSVSSVCPNEINENTCFENQVLETKSNEVEDDVGEKSSSSCYPDETDREVEAEKISTDVSSGDDSFTKPKKTKNKTGKCKTPKLDGKIAKHDTKVAQSDKPRSVLESIKDKKLLSRKDRLLQKIPKVSMPDLSFKPSSRSLEASDSYLTCLGSGSTTSEDNVTEKSRKNQTVVLQEDKNENFKVAHLSLQDPPDPTLGMVCLISHMVSPAEIYINPADDNVGLLDSLTYQFAEIYEKTISPYATKNDVKASVGNYCLGYIDDWSSWYRIEIINWRLEETANPDLVTVKLVDYGHVTDVDFRNLRELLYDFCYVPKYAIKCHLAHLYPPGSKLDSLVEAWPADSLKHLYDITNNESGDCFKLTFVEKNGDSWAVELISVHEADEQNSVGHQLLMLGGAVEILPDPTGVFRDDFLINQLKTAQGFSGMLGTMTEEERLDKFYDNSVNYEPNNLDEALTCYKANDEKRICQFARDGTCFKGPKCRLEHGQLRKDGYTTDRQYVYTTSFNAIALPKSGDILKLFVTSIVNVNTFYCNLVGKSSSYKELKNLIKSMNDQCTVDKYKSLQITPACGELVIANRLQDQWYRAQVLDNYHFPDKNEATIQVFLVDLGETIDVTMSELRQIEPVYLNLPFQAILCKLSNVRPNEGDESSEEAKSYCESHFLCQLLKAKVIYSSHTYLEVLMAKKNGDDVGEQIIAEGHGLLKTDSYVPKCIEKILID